MRYLIITLIILFLFSCANQTAPTGGPKDEEPPVLENADPKDQSLNVETKTIELEFDEYVKLNQAKEQIIISPRLENELTFSARRNSVIIEFEDELPDSTTFTISFREGVQDITEGNSPANLKLAFSTGPYLDSLSITGQTIGLLTQTPVADYSIFLYNAADTMNIFEDPPLYFTKTNEEGFFSLENLANGTYLIYAVEDLNKNLLLDFKSESYSFLDSAIILKDTAKINLNLPTYFLNAAPQALRSARQNGTVYEIKYEKYITHYELITQPTQFLHSNYLDDKHKSIIVYNYNIRTDSLLTYVNVTDSLGYVTNDTTYLKFEETVRKPKDLEMSVSLDDVFPSDGLLSGSIKFNKPIISYNFDSVYIFLDSVNIIPIDTSQILTENREKDLFKLNYGIPLEMFKPKEKTPSAPPTQITKDSSVSESKKKPIPPAKPHLYLGYSAFISVDSDSSSQTITDLKFSKIEDYGQLFITVQTDRSGYIIELLNNKYEVIQQKINNSDFSFDKIKPGEYFIRVLIDENNNGKWDTGDIYTKTLPEELFYYESSDGERKIILRANWETPITLSF